MINTIKNNITRNITRKKLIFLCVVVELLYIQNYSYIKLNTTKENQYDDYFSKLEDKLNYFNHT